MACDNEDRKGWILVWDDFHKEGKNFDKYQSKARAKIRQLLRVEDNGFDLSGYDLGSERTVEDYQNFAGLDFTNHRIQKYTLDNGVPHNPPVSEENPWYDSFYYCINTPKDQFKLDDYDNMVIAFDDEKGESVFRSDWNELEIKKDFLSRAIGLVLKTSLILTLTENQLNG